MGKLHLEVVTPSRILVSADVDMVVAPGTEGQFGILPGHVSFLSGIVPGELRYTSGSDRESFVVTNGFAEVSNDRMSVIVDAAEKVSEIDVERARKAMERARERLAQDRKSTDIDFTRAEAALNRAITRIRIAEKSI
ncbi:MAG: F0F1 ATP synthase subunit epsilon [Desulfobacteraceae bacterium]|nr:MAG: F0F1 ATP synthase subunit epsilon [Desulfobacteraceae bacterium]